MPRSDAAGDGAPPESASMTILKDLHAAGVFSDEEFAARGLERRLGQAPHDSTERRRDGGEL